MNSFHTDGEYVSPHIASLAGLESNHKSQHQLQIWDWAPVAAQTHQATETPFFNPHPYGLSAFGVAGGVSGYPFHCSAAEDYPTGIIKNEEDRCAAQIGLNLGRRTYFPSGEAAAIEQLFRRSRGMYQASQQTARCQAEGCKADLAIAKHYHRRHKVCELHSKASVVVAGGVQQRFCQQCSRFHPLSEFDEAKRSCRKRLAEHNRRRRKSESSSTTSSAGVDRSEPTNHSGVSKDSFTHTSSGPTRNFEDKSPIPSATKSISTVSRISHSSTTIDDSKAVTQHWNGPSLSLGGGSGGPAQVKAHNFGFLAPFHSQLPSWVVLPDDDNSANHRSSSSSNLFLHSQALFCNTPAEASHSAATAGEASLLQLGQGLLEVDFL
ncbi:uncharacterized protein LOC144708572 isoform X2 [Wolffia australiana]